jgi:hypothetical protein
LLPVTQLHSHTPTHSITSSTSLQPTPPLSTFIPTTQSPWVSGVRCPAHTSAWKSTDRSTDKGEDSYEQVYNNDNFEENKSSFGHELVAGGAAFAGFKAFEDHQRKEGKPVSHAFAKELVAGFAAAEVDKVSTPVLYPSELGLTTITAC